jgi:hypothetical protein
MNRVFGTILVIMLAVVLACDTSNSVEPRNESFFFKLYSGLIAGDDVAADITTTLDNGLAFVGTSYQGAESLTAEAEMLVVKTGIDGNEQWKFGSSSEVPGTKIRGNSILALNDGSAIVAGGTMGDFRSAGSTPILFMLNPETGVMEDTLSLSSLPNTDPTYFYELKSITQTRSYLVLSGETNNPTPAEELNGSSSNNGFIAIVETIPGDLSFRILNSLQIFGLELDNDVIAGAFEIQDTDITDINVPRFIAFSGTKEGSGDSDFQAWQFTSDLRNPFSDKTLSTDGGLTPVAVARIADTYWVLGDESPANQVFLAQWENSDWSNFQGRVGSTSNVSAGGIDLVNNTTIVLAGDITAEIFLAKVGTGLNVNDPWPRTFGASGISYSSSAVKVLPDGSIVTLGTADLEPTKKIVLIKTGPNGEMSFE